MLYHRLSTLKEAALALSKNEANVARLSPYAVELGLAVPQPQIDDPAVPRGKNYYEYMLELCEKFFDAEIDSQTFEENLRYMWGIKAFPAFTVDKLCLSMIKHVRGARSIWEDSLRKWSRLTDMDHPAHCRRSIPSTGTVAEGSCWSCSDRRDLSRNGL